MHLVDLLPYPPAEFGFEVRTHCIVYLDPHLSIKFECEQVITLG